MKKLFISAFLLVNLCAFAQHSTELMVAAQNEQFISLKYSPKAHRMFVTTNSGKMIVLNEQDEIIHVVPFSGLGHVDLDDSGKVGAFSDENYNVYIFDQQTLEITNSFKATTVSGQGALRVFFTKHGLFLSTFKNIYLHDGSGVVKVLASFGAVDYDSTSDQFLLAKWNQSLTYDRKVTELYTARVTNLDTKKLVHTVVGSFELYSYLTNNGTNLVTCDGKGRYTFITLKGGSKSTITQEGLQENQRRYGLAKINNTTIMTMRYYPFAMVFENASTHDLLKTMTITESIVNNQVIEKNGSLYYITSGGNGNKLIAIK